VWGLINPLYPLLFLPAKSTALAGRSKMNELKIITASHQLTQLPAPAPSQK